MKKYILPLLLVNRTKQIILSKKLTVIFFLVLLVTKTNAQFPDPQTYELSFGIVDYQPLNTSDSLINIDGPACVNCKGTYWSDDQTDTSIEVVDFYLNDFDINLYSQTYRVRRFPIAANRSGDISLIDYNQDSSKSGESRIVLNFQRLRDRGTKNHSVSPIRKKIEGVKPNRVLKLEYRNAGFVVDDTNLDSINIQFWYIEADSSVEIHWGECSVKNQKMVQNNEGKDHFFATFMTRTPYNGSNEFDEIIRVGGTVDSLYGVTSNKVSPFTFQGVPHDGQYFRFSRKKASVGIGNLKTIAAAVFPNPSSGLLYIRGIDHRQACTVRLYNLAGQPVLSQKLAAMEDVVDLQMLSNGLYMLHIEQNGKYYTTKVVKQ